MKLYAVQIFCVRLCDKITPGNMITQILVHGSMIIIFIVCCFKILLFFIVIASVVKLYYQIVFVSIIKTICTNFQHFLHCLSCSVALNYIEEPKTAISIRDSTKREKRFELSFLSLVSHALEKYFIYLPTSVTDGVLCESVVQCCFKNVRLQM